MIATARAARFYGFLPTSVKLTDYQRDWLRALFGQQRMTIPAHGKTQRPVNVYYVPVFGGAKLDSNLNLLEQKRQGIWQQPVRNRRIVGLARLLVKKDTQGMATKFPVTVSGVLRLAKARVGILTETVDHALELGRKLPDWPILAGDSMTFDGLPPADIQRLMQGAVERGRSPHVLVTMAGLARVGRLDIVIRADGGIGLPDLDMGVSTYVNGRPRTLTIIDFDDGHHRKLKLRSEQRRQAYQDAGWRMPQYPQSDLDLFLTTRPKVQWT